MKKNIYIQQYKELKLIFNFYIGEPNLNTFISNPDMKTKYPIGIIDLGHQTDYITPKKVLLFQEYGVDPINARLFLISIRQRELELISDGNELIEVKLI